MTVSSDNSLLILVSSPRLEQYMSKESVLLTTNFWLQPGVIYPDRDSNPGYKLTTRVVKQSKQMFDFF